MFAAPFDPVRLTLTGAAQPVIVGVSRGAGGAAHVAVAEAGTLAYVPGSAATTFTQTLPTPRHAIRIVSCSATAEATRIAT